MSYGCGILIIKRELTSKNKKVMNFRKRKTKFILNNLSGITKIFISHFKNKNKQLYLYFALYINGMM